MNLPDMPQEMRESVATLFDETLDRMMVVAIVGVLGIGQIFLLNEYFKRTGESAGSLPVAYSLLGLVIFLYFAKPYFFFGYGWRSHIYGKFVLLVTIALIAFSTGLVVL